MFIAINILKDDCMTEYWVNYDRIFSNFTMSAWMWGDFSLRRFGFNFRFETGVFGFDEFV